MQKNKKTYSLSASLFNNIEFYNKFPEVKNYDSIINNISGIFITNEAIERGFKYEEEVFAGKHGKISQLVMPLEKQIWGSKVIDCGDFYIRIAGKVDAIDRDKKRIYDIKRTSNYNPLNYINSIQHMYYLYIFPEITDFFYLVAYGKDEIDGQEIVHIKRPPEEELNKIIKDSVIKFVNFLKDEKLWDLYTKYKVYHGR